MDNTCRCLIACLIGIVLVLSLDSAAFGQRSVQQRCAPQAGTGFDPRAIALLAANVRAEPPQYSVLTGRWELGRQIGVLPANQCLEIWDRRIIGGVQIWYSVRYKETPLQIRRGWVWGGTQGVDEDVYFAGDTKPTHPQPSSRQSDELLGWLFGVTPAYAETSLPPQTGEGTNGPNYVVLPVLGLIRLSALSAFVLFVLMVTGMVAKAVWDKTETGGLWPDRTQIVRPMLISPIAFSTFWGTMYLQQGLVGLSLTGALYAFQIGFMWQHVLQGKLSEPGPARGAPAVTQDRPESREAQAGVAPKLG